jgi:putative component of membrane protein insertase Oxa1/YidC/SpoIIIJ protein YidD
MIKYIAVLSIQFYQKFISPYKGFSCAHRVATKEISCSGYGKKVINRFGIIKGYLLLNRRFYDCKWHSIRLNKQKMEDNGRYLGSAMKHQRGFVDCDCSGVDCDIFSSISECNILPDGSDCACSALDACDIGDCFPNKNKQSFKNKRNSSNNLKYPENENNENGLSLKKEDN